MPLFNYGKPFGQAPGYTPSGRGVKYSADEAKAADILANINAYGAKPGQYSQQQIDWAKGILPDQAPIVHNARLANPFGMDYGAWQGLKYAIGSGQIGPQSDIYGSLGPLLQGQARKYYNPANAVQSAGPQGFTTGTPGSPAPTSALPSGRQITTGVATPATPAQGGFTGSLTPGAQLAGTLSSFDSQWNDQNDPGGFIRKWQQQQANQPWSGVGGGSQYFSPGQAKSFSVSG